MQCTGKAHVVLHSSLNTLIKRLMDKKTIDLFMDTIDPHTFELQITMRGIRRTLGDVTKQARPLSVEEMLLIHASLDFSNSEDIGFWTALILCFRGLLRKSNVVEKGLALLVGDVFFFHWGILVRLRRTKTVSFKERVLEIPFSYIPGSPFCVASYIKLLLSSVGHSGVAQLISYLSPFGVVRGTYSWLSSRITRASKALGLDSFTTHSLRRGGASALSDANFSLIDIKNLGDWQSLSVLHYLNKTPSSKLELDSRICTALFS